MGGGTGRRSSGPDWAQAHEPSHTLMGVANNGGVKSEHPHHDVSAAWSRRVGWRKTYS